MSKVDPKMLFGFLLLVLLSLLAAVIALGKVEQNTSYGLQYLLGSLSTLAGAFATWAFSNKGGNDNDKGEPK